MVSVHTANTKQCEDGEAHVCFVARMSRAGNLVGMELIKKLEIAINMSLQLANRRRPRGSRFGLDLVKR